jgi:CIC family chloride channel protein
MTGSYRIILPLMLSCIIAAVLSGQIRRESIYTLKPTAGAWTSARAAR